ncbi:MAG TPA: PHB depolymerase family esterase, partial [Burkholderiaceae bacterium]|nr:PHB depolymerase family esterase [Burkholderiaceae bacterium]
SVPPYISNCRFDGAGEALQWIYGALHPPNAGKLGGELTAFDQTPFIGPGYGMDRTGWLYVPASCRAGRRCALHVALHGCQQAYAVIGEYFVDNTGFNRWADTNDLIVLYPQATASLINPFACWDWFGLYGADFDQKSGAQMKAIIAMIRHAASADSAIAPTEESGHRYPGAATITQTSPFVQSALPPR